MKKIIAQEQSEWTAVVSDWLRTKKALYKAKSLYLPAGESPKLIYRDWELHRPLELENLKLIQIDDVLSGAKKDLFKKFFHDELPSYAADIEYFEHGRTQADLALLGLGLNGHVAFHEPGLPEDFYSGCVKLKAETLKNLDLESNTWGKTYGAGAFNRCKAVLMIVKGTGKKEILQNIMSGRTKAPATALLSHPDFSILSDFEF